MVDTPVCAVWHKNKLDKKSSHQVLAAFQAAYATIRSAWLGFEAQQCRCTLPVSLPIPSCSLADRQATISLCYIRKRVKQLSKHIAKQMLTFWSFRMIPDIPSCIVSNYNPWQHNNCNNAKTRHTLDATSPNRWSYGQFLFSTDQLTKQKQLVEEASSYQLLKVLGEGRVEITFNSKPNPCMHIFLIFF